MAKAKAKGKKGKHPPMPKALHNKWHRTSAPLTTWAGVMQPAMERNAHRVGTFALNQSACRLTLLEVILKRLRDGAKKTGHIAC